MARRLLRQYTDIPDGTDCHRKAYASTAISTSVGLVASSYSLIHRPPASVLEGVARAGRYTFTAAAIGAVFGLTSCVSAKVREKPDDPLNYLLGGCAGGLVLGARSECPPAPSPSPLYPDSREGTVPLSTAHRALHPPSASLLPLCPSSCPRAFAHTVPSAWSALPQVSAQLPHPVSAHLVGGCRPLAVPSSGLEGTEMLLPAKPLVSQCPKVCSVQGHCRLSQQQRAQRV